MGGAVQAAANVAQDVAGTAVNVGSAGIINKRKANQIGGLFTGRMATDALGVTSAEGRKAPTVPGQSKVPQLEDLKSKTANSTAARDVRKQAAVGRKDTILTSPLGLTDGPLLKKKTLLGQ